MRFLFFILGFLFVFLVPPFQGPDEPHHFQRAEQLSRFELFGFKKNGLAGAELPVALTDETHRFEKMPGDGGKKTSRAELFEWAARSPRWSDVGKSARRFTVFQNTLVYSPVPYLVPISVIWVSKLFDLRVLTTFYLCRLFSFLFFFFVLSYFLKRQGLIGKGAFWPVALSPMAVFLITNVSADTLTILLCFVSTAEAIGIAQKRSQLGARHCVLASMLALSKFVYLLVGLMPFVAAVLVSRKNILKSIAGSLFAFALNCCWLFWVKDIGTPIRYDADVSSSAQIMRVLRHPEVLFSVFGDYFVNAWWYLKSFLGLLGWHDCELPKAAYVAQMFVYFLVFAFHQPRVSGVLFRGAALLSSALTIVFITLIHFVTCAPVGWNRPDGLPGRYFLPIVPLLLLGLASTKRNRLRNENPKSISLMLGILVLFISFVTIRAILRRYYV